MDVSPVQSGSKCSSDFSIDRLLSDDTRGQGSEQVPDWLCCTRYRPPRLPRAPSVCRSRRAGRHARVPFTAAQAGALEAAYSRAPYLAPPALRALAAALQLRDDRIKIWFQNRRARERREKSANIAPPTAVTLPPTALVTTITPNWIPNHITEPHRIDVNLITHMQRNFNESTRTTRDIETNERFVNERNSRFYSNHDDDDSASEIEIVED